jgi:hypothetical protein
MKNINTRKNIIITEKLNEVIDIPVEHQRIVLERMEKSKINPERLLDWDKVSKNL